MIVSAWKAATYGIRVGQANAREYFDRSWEQVEVEINGKFYSFKLSPTFWTTCPELRGGPIPDWLKEQGLVPWPKGKPPKFRLEPLGDKKFRLYRNKNK